MQFPYIKETPLYATPHTTNAVERVIAPQLCSTTAGQEFYSDWVHSAQEWRLSATRSIATTPPLTRILRILRARHAIARARACRTQELHDQLVANTLMHQLHIIDSVRAV